LTYKPHVPVWAAIVAGHGLRTMCALEHESTYGSIDPDMAAMMAVTQ